MPVSPSGESGRPFDAGRELDAVKRFPEGNPNPVLQLDDRGVLVYANPAAAPLVEGLGLELGSPVPDGLAGRLEEALSSASEGPFDVSVGDRWFAVVPVDARELGVVNLYATDVTAARVLERFPNWNPNPVLRVSRDGTLLYANDAAAPVVTALGVRTGERLEAASLAGLLACLEQPQPEPFEVRHAGRHYALHPRFVPELGTINVYGTDVTALRAIDTFPDENPNPVLRLTRDGRLQYANPVAAPLTQALGVEVGEPLPADFRADVDDIVARASEERLELNADGRTFELRAVSVYEYDFVNLYGTDVTAARAVEAAHRENERLLLAILPPSIADRLRRGETTIADGFDDMSVLFADLVGFTELSSRLSASEVVRILNDVFSAYDELADLHGLEKIKTIGDAYMAVGGLTPQPDGRDHAAAMAEAALEMVDATERVAAGCGQDVRVRIGLHAGPTVAGVIGMRKFIYDVWGDAVNQASRMESYGLPGRVQVAEETYRRLRDSFAFESRGELEVKGLGPVRTYFLVGRGS